ncbi:MAG: glycosyltransferase [Muribaculaceae bacterium]|nr:glycosyltransferase [Muribaculaceae bacterium]
MEIIRFTNITDLREQILNAPLEQFVLLNLTDKDIEFDSNCLHRFTQMASETDATLTYSYFRDRLPDGTIKAHPVSDFQIGSVRDDFDFGPLVMLNAADVLAVTENMEEESQLLDGGWYALRLRITAGRIIAMIPETLYTASESDTRKSGAKQHDYVNPRNREYQKQMESVFIKHLHYIDGWIDSSNLATIDADEDNHDEFPVEASVIIPVRNRARTIMQAVKSALSQETDSPINVIVVDNGSTDGTRELLESCTDPRLVLIKAEPKENLGIGGCWNKAILDARCGRYAVQLDSDDLYSSESSVQQILDKFREGKYAMVIGSYELVDGDCRPIPPGLINHEEWTDEEGPNNALRINGLGAPRAFFTPIARKFMFPNVSYGEDYAMALRITREYKLGRIFSSLYLCRRWEGNSDAALSQEKINEHNAYKDCIRSYELMSRFRANSRNAPEIAWEGPIEGGLQIPDMMRDALNRIFGENDEDEDFDNSGNDDNPLDDDNSFDDDDTDDDLSY